MARDDELVNRIRAALADLPDVEEKRMFGSTAFMVRGKLCVAARPERIMCRIDPARHEEALKRKGSSTVFMRGRDWPGYLHVDVDVLRTKQDLDYWLGLALDYNEKAEASAGRRKRRAAGR